MLRIGIIGAAGKMGKELCELCEKDPDIQLVSCITRLERSLNSSVDLLIDFSSASCLSDNLKLALENNCPILIGTTGLFEKDRELLATFAKKIPIFYAENFSLGIALTKKLVKEIYQFFKASATVDIIETHHIEKKDRPSGTALSLNREIDNKAQICSLRRPKVVGDHSIVFSLDDQEIEITHRAKTRAMFAKGAIECAKFLHNKSFGLYNIDDYMREVNGKCLPESRC